MPPVLFLDRDGVLNADRADFVKRPEEWVPLPGSLDAAARLSRAGFSLVVITNQSGVGRGLFSERDLEAIHAKMMRQVEAAGGRITAIYFCPHAPEADCGCRKPRPGLIERACQELGVEAAEAMFVGDRLSDVEAAVRAGCRPVLLSADAGMALRLAERGHDAVEVLPDLAALADRIA